MGISIGCDGKSVDNEGGDTGNTGREKKGCANMWDFGLKPASIF